MQYLSKAYQYYSGINPATLTGAIDVIVVRRLDENGDYIYSCSPFHVRFGKLQVLRAGEKKVTIQLPDNLPASSSSTSNLSPSIDRPTTPGDASSSTTTAQNEVAIERPKGFEAPFWMKVGEAGEAFFVVETDEEVPLDLQTSPVVAAVDAPPTPPTSDEELFGSSSRRLNKGKEKVTHGDFDSAKPFDGGELDEQVGKTTIEYGRAGAISTEPDFLDLDVADEDKGSDPKVNGSSGSGGSNIGQPGDSIDERVSSFPIVSHQDASAVSSDQAVGQSSMSPSSILSTASSLIPSILKPASSSPSLAHFSEDATETRAKDTRSATPPPNPLRKESDPEPHGAPTIKDYMKDAVENVTRTAARRMSSVSSIVTGGGSSAGVPDVENTADVLLPAIKDGEGEGPKVVYKRDVVLDMQGYHNEELQLLPDDIAAEQQSLPASAEETPSAAPEKLNGITDSLKADLHSDITAGSDDYVTTKLISFTQDLLASAEPAGEVSLPLMPAGTGAATFPRMKRRTEVGISAVERQFDHLDISTGRVTTHLPTDEHSAEHHGRATSEPPADTDLSNEVPAEIPGQDLSESYTWAWGELPLKTPIVADETAESETKFAAKPEPSNLFPSHLDHSVRRNSAPGLTPSAPIPIRGPTSEDTFSPARPGAERAKTQPANLDLVPGSDAVRSSVDGPRLAGGLKNSEANPYRFILDMGFIQHVFEIAFWDQAAVPEEISQEDFAARRVTFQQFIEDPTLVDSPRLVMMYDDSFISWQNASPVMAALAIYRKSLQPPSLVASSGTALPPLASIGIDPSVVAPPASKGYGWSRWWRRGQSPALPLGGAAPPTPSRPELPSVHSEPVLDTSISQVADTSSRSPAPLVADTPCRHYAKTLRLTSDQLSQLNLKEGSNKVIFSVTSSYSGVASCTARIFLWNDDDHVVISDIDGTITKSDALGHVFAAIGRDWTHLGVAKLYTDICNNGYKIMYLTSRAIGQADSTRDYLKGIHQGRYQLPDGPVIMSPDRLMASLHREVIMRKPEIFKMACLRDIQRLFASGPRNPFYAGFGNRITDAMSYRSVNIPSSRIFTIDSGGEVKMELLELVGYKSSYIHMTDLVDQMFPPIHRKIIPEYTDFNYWRPAIAVVDLPDLTPVSPALSATSEGSRMSVLRSLTSLGRRTSKTPLAPSEDGSTASTSRPKAHRNASRPNSPLFAAYSASDVDDDELLDPEDFSIGARKGGIMPGSLPDRYDRSDSYLRDGTFTLRDDEESEEEEMDDERYHRAQSEPANQTYGSWEGSDGAFEARQRAAAAGQGEQGDEEYPDMEFDDEMLATGEMSKVPY